MYDKKNSENSDCGPIAYEYLYYKAVEDKICRKYDVCLNLCLRSPKQNLNINMFLKQLSDIV